jgi:urease accessory protein UreF
MNDKEWNSLVNREKRQVHRDTISMWHCAEVCRLPPNHSQTSFGIENLDQVRAIQWCIENRKITPMQLEESKKNGKKLTALISTSENPFKTDFITIWDMKC